jgi:1,4-alpha-glucan branching enzyme
MAITRAVSFRLRAPDAASVAIAGDFNNWSAGARRMRRRKDGVWWVVLRLRPGTYQYKFVIDESDWQADPSNPRQVPNGQGTVNSICEVT